MYISLSELVQADLRWHQNTTKHRNNIENVVENVVGNVVGNMENVENVENVENM